MRTWVRPCLITLALAVAWAPVATADVLNSVHDFSAEGAGHLCGSCHAPHEAAQSLLVWNHTLSTNSFSWSDSSSTIGGTTLPSFAGDGTQTGMSKYCLSCHDGTVTPGSVNSTLPDFDTYTYSGTAAPTIATGAGDMAGNHPVGVPYPYNNSSSTYDGSGTAVTTGANVNMTDFVATPESSGVKLYRSTPGDDATTGIECGSCHDPHLTTNTFFLRVAVADLCTSCHSK